MAATARRWGRGAAGLGLLLLPTRGGGGGRTGTRQHLRPLLLPPAPSSGSSSRCCCWQGGFPGHFTGQKVAGVNASVWSAPLPASLGVTSPFDNLYIGGTGGRRVTRAKAPNGNPELTIDGFAGGAQSWLPPQRYPAPQDVSIASPSRPDDPFFATYQLGVGGTCAIFDPPQVTMGGGRGGAVEALPTILVLA